MRKILFIICWALAGVGLYSCSLDEPSYGKTTSDNYYQKESDIEQALTGAYLQLRTTWNEYALNHYFVGDCSTDDALKGGGNDGDRAEVRDLSDFTIYTTNGEVGRRWEILYRLINRCNDVIYYAPDAIGNEELLKRYANEAKALRAFGYYCLVTTFGEVPLITTPMQPAEILQIPRSYTYRSFSEARVNQTSPSLSPQNCLFHIYHPSDTHNNGGSPHSICDSHAKDSTLKLFHPSSFFLQRYI